MLPWTFVSLVTTNLADYGAPPIVWIDHGFLATTDRTASAVPPSDLLAENPKHHSMAFTCQARCHFLATAFSRWTFAPSIGMTHSTITYKNIIHLKDPLPQFWPVRAVAHQPWHLNTRVEDTTKFQGEVLVCQDLRHFSSNQWSSNYRESTGSGESRTNMVECQPLTESSTWNWKPSGTCCSATAKKEEHQKRGLGGFLTWGYPLVI